jgi:hypothetical protein
VSTSWVLWTSETTTSTAPVSAEAKGALRRGRVLVPVGAQARERARELEGHLCEHPQSQLLGGDPTRSFDID